MITKTPYLMDPIELLNAAGLAGVFLVFMIPSIAIVLSIYALYRYRKNQKAKKEYNKQVKEHFKGEQEKLKDTFKEQNKKISLDKATPDDFEVRDEPEDKRRFQSLGLEFDETGRVK